MAAALGGIAETALGSASGAGAASPAGAMFNPAGWHTRVIPDRLGGFAWPSSSRRVLSVFS